MGAKNFLLRALRVIGLLVFFGWWVFQAATTWIGRSTVPEDAEVAKGRLADFVDWLLTTPSWVPASLAITFGAVVLFPGAFWTVIQAMRGRQPAKPKPEAIAAESTTSDKAPVATAEADQFGGTLLGGPIGSIPAIKMSQAPSRVNPETEHEAKKRAKEEIVRLAKDYFYPAVLALGNFKCLVRERFLMRFDRKGSAREVISQAIDRGKEKPSTRHDYANIHDLQSIDKIRKLNLYETETSIYHAAIDYAQDVRLAISLLDECEPADALVIHSVREIYQRWRDLHDKFVAREIALGKEYLDLNTVGNIHERAVKDIPEPNWEKITIPSR